MRPMTKEPIRVPLENAVPEDPFSRYRLHLREQSAHAVADKHHVLRFGIKLIVSSHTLPKLERGQRNRIACRATKARDTA
jgi:hypothetical protein